MIESSRAVFFFEPAFDREAMVDVFRAWQDVQGFNPSDEFETIAGDIAKGESTWLDGRWESVVTSILANEKGPEQLPDLPHLAVDLREQYFAPGRADEEAVPEYIGDFGDFVVRCYERARDVGHQPMYVLGADPNQLSALFGEKSGTVDTSRTGILAGTIEQLYWLQILPPRMVEDLGLETVLSAPSWRSDELDDGAALLVAYVNPHSPDFERKEDLEEHVGARLRTYWV